MSTRTPFITHLHQMLVPPHQPRLMWLETAVITLGSLALAFYFVRDNPFQIGGDFPWIWLAPVMVALRYGVAPGVGSALLLIAVWLLRDKLAATNEDFPEQFFLGGLILTMVCGEFSALWSARLRRAKETNQYLDERLSRITMRHLLLRLSHDRLEQELLTKPVTLRDALGGLRELAGQPHEVSLPAANSMLQMLSQYCQLESAAVFLPDGGGYKQVSTVGTPPELATEDPLLRYALTHRTLAHLMTEHADNTNSPSPFLVVAPILAAGDKLKGVLAVDRMPFLAVNDENLQMLSVMLNYYADCVDEVENTRLFRTGFPDMPMDFAAEFSRLLHLQRNFKLDSYIVALPFGNDEQGRQAVANLAHMQRGLDLAWQTMSDDRLWFINLLPLANDHAVEGYVLRVENKLKALMEIGNKEWSLTSFRIGLDEDDPVQTLQRLIRGHHA